MKKTLGNNHGITLIELIAVIGIIGIIYLISAPLYRTFQTTMLLKGTSRGVVSYIEQAKSLAMNFNRSFKVAIDTTSNKLATTDTLAVETTEDKIQKVKEYLIPRQLKIKATSATGNELTISSTGSMESCSIKISNTQGTSCYTITTSGTGTLRIYPYEKN
jgi:prepilin-type N-terminal cleavage/methylation domain-containing protein